MIWDAIMAGKDELWENMNPLQGKIVMAQHG